MRRRRNAARAVAVVVVVLLSPGADVGGRRARAAEPYESVVTASRTEAPLADAPIATEVIRRDEIERTGARDVAELLAQRPGVQLNRGWAGAQLTLQGLDGQYILVLVDGQRLIGRVDGAIDLSRIYLDDVERVEIVRGPSSALYGADALGGVVHIITRRTRRRWEADAMASYGSLNAADARAAIGHKRPRVAVHATGGFHRRDPYRLDPTAIATSGSGLMQFEVGLRVEARGARRWKLGGAVDYLQRRLDGVDSSGGGAVLDRRTITELASVQLTPEIVFDSAPARLRLSAGWSTWRDQYRSDQRGGEALDSFSDTREHLGVISAQLDRVDARHALTIGGEAQVEALSSQRLVGDGLRGRGAVYLQDQWLVVASRRLVVVPALRLDLDSQFGSALSPKLAVRFDPHPRLVLRASWGRGFRPPSFKELLLKFENPGAGYVVDGNSALRPERSDGVNGGVEVRAHPLVWLSANGFYNELEDLITYRVAAAGGADGPQRFSYVNVARARTRGLETMVRLGPVVGLTLELGYTLTDARDESRGRPLDGRALHAGSFALSFLRPSWGLEAMARGTVLGPRPYSVEDARGEVTTVWTAPMVQLEARVAYTVKRHVTAFVGGQNLLDAGDPRYSPLVPRSFYGGISGRY